LNELLGAWEPENNNTSTPLPKTEATDTGRAPHTDRSRAKRSRNTRLQERYHTVEKSLTVPERAQNCNRRITRRETFRRELRPKPATLPR
jgi:hypothetical protein